MLRRSLLGNSVRISPSKVFCAVTLGLILATGATAYGSPVGVKARINAQNNSSGKPVTFAFAMSFSGPTAFMGIQLEPGLRVACAQINAAGGILGHKCQEERVDTLGDAADGALALRKAFSSGPQINAVIGLGSGQAPEVPIVVGQKVVAFSLAGDQILFDNKKYAKYLYMGEPPDSQTGVSMALAVKQLKLHHPAVVFSASPDAAPVRTGVLDGLRNLKITPSSNLKVAQGAASYGTEVGRILAGHPDGIVMEISDPASAATFFSNFLAQAGSVKIPFIVDATASGQQWNDAVAHAIGQKVIDKYEWIANTQNGNTETPSYKIMLKEWPKFKGPEPFNASFNTPIYDAVIISALAMQEARSTVPSVWAPNVYRLDAGQKGAVKVYTFAQGKKALAKGRKIQYVGATNGFGWNSYHSRIVPAFLYRRNGNHILPSSISFTVKQINAAAK